MSDDLKRDLAHAARHYASPEDALRRLERRRDRKRRHGRLGALVVGLTVAALSVWLVSSALQTGHGPHPGSEPTPTAVSPSNGPLPNAPLLYAKKLPDGWNLFSFDPSTGQERRITTGVRDYSSDWSPDGTKIVYDSEHIDSGTYDIVVANADGTHPTVLGPGQDPAWSPDGTRIAYVGGGGRIWVMNTDGSDAHPVTEGAASGTGTGDDAAYDWHPAWSPDGRSIAYVRIAAHRRAPVPRGHYLVDVTLQQVRVWHGGATPTDTMLTDAYTGVGELDWSPDGSTIVFTGAPTLFYEPETDGLAWPRVLLIPSAGGEVTPISPQEKAWAEGATWSPDGAWIAYVEYVDNSHALVVMRPDGTDRRTLPVDPGEGEIIGPSWGVAPPASP
ncbi:MAG: hypothetical protein M3Q23_03650 [Actinomycetota bacterium]|nr:hypothetical protein [Actinomycetota bacterium]